jgi:hypothetical protein
MKIFSKAIAFGLLTFLALLPSAYGQRIGWEPVTSGNMPQSTVGGNSGGYYGSSGAQYQFDMNNPVDRNRYSTDTGAQMRDQVESYTDRTLDRMRGQNGGGYYGR